MSFGFSPGDVFAAATLAWKLYEALKDGPAEVEKISKDLTTVYSILSHVKEDLDASESAILAHGEHRIRMLETMVRDLNKSLSEVNKMVEEYRNLHIAHDKSMVKKKSQIWVRIKWVVGQKRIKRIHKDISLHISRFSLLMTSMGK
jgi:DNA repair ATPase RecN